jgi:hypothetical protein
MGEIMGNIISGGMKVEEAVELYKEQAQDAVDQLYINKD